MKTPDGYLAATGALLCATSLTVSSCAARLAAPSALQSSTHAPVSVAPRGAGSLEVRIPWPSFTRSGQFLYGGGSSVAAVEVFLTDSLDNYQSAVILRNPAAGGNNAGTATVPFYNVPAGPVTVSVHTTYNQLLGSLINPSTVASTSFIVGGNTVVPIVGDQTTPFVAFRSTDLLNITADGGPHAFLTTARVYQNTRTGADEMTDDGSLMAGYGIGAATASVVAGGTTTVAVTVAQAPSFATGLYSQTSTFSAGSAMSLGASIQPGDVLLATDSALPTTTDVVDLSKDLGATFSLAVSGSNVNFTTTTAFPAKAGKPYAAQNLYLLRGSMVSLVNLAGQAPPQLVIEPATVSIANSSIMSGGGAIAPSGVSSVAVLLRDEFGNPINDLGPLSLTNPNATVSASVSPQTVNNTSFLVPGFTYGQMGAFAQPSDMVNHPGVWNANYVEGSVADSTHGATASIAASGGDFNSLNGVYIPYNTLNPSGAFAKVTVGVTGTGVGPFTVKLFQDASTNSVNVFGSPIAVPAQGSSPDVAGGTLTAGSPFANILTLAGAISTADDGTQFSMTSSNVGSRAKGDTDLVTISFSGNATPIGSGVTYSWK